MSEVVVIDPTAGREASGDSESESFDVSKTVESQEGLEKTVPRLVYAVLIAGPLLVDVVRQGEIKIGALFGAVIWFFVAKFVVWLLRITIINPLHRSRYDNAAKKLKHRLKASLPLSLGPYSWTIDAPGALGATSTGDLIVINKSTGYRQIRIPAGCIADVRVERRSQMLTTTKHSGRSLIGTRAGSIGIGYATGGRSTSVTQQIDEFFLEIRYQLERNGPVLTQVVPGGSDHRVVEELCAAINRLEATA